MDILFLADGTINAVWSEVVEMAEDVALYFSDSMSQVIALTL